MLLMLTIRFFALVAASSLVSVVKFAPIRATQELSGMTGVPGERAYETGHYWLRRDQRHLLFPSGQQAIAPV
jgi:hypothetical protein